MKLFWKLYGIHVLYVLIYSLLMSFSWCTFLLVFQNQTTGIIVNSYKDFIASAIYAFMYIPAGITFYTWGTYWLIPLLYFFKKTSTYLVLLFSVEIIMIIGIMVRLRLSDLNYYGTTWHMIYDFIDILIILVLAYYKYKHIKRILANG